MTNARELAEKIGLALRQHSSGVLYGLPGGGNNLEIIGAAESEGLRFVLAHGETAATIMAAVHAELTGKVTAAVVTRGPGAASAVNGIAQAKLDHQPIWLLTDVVSVADSARVAHQWIDQHALFSPVSKWSTVLGAIGAEDVLTIAAKVATNPAPGPVHLDFDPTAERRDSAPRDVQPSGALAEVKRLLRKARRPAIIVGQGGRNCGEGIACLLTDSSTPVLTTYKAVGVIPSTDPHFAGLFTGARMESPVLDDADLVLTIGLDSVELIPNSWPYNAPVVSLSEWPDSRRYFTIVAEVIGPLASLLSDLDPIQDDWPSDYATAHNERGLNALMYGPSNGQGIAPWELVHSVRQAAPCGSVATIDAGAHMLAAMALWTVGRPGELLISSGLATMGYALPAAIAAAIVHPNRRVYCLTGDGGLGMVLGELETVARLNLPVTIVVFNDATLSLIKLKQRPEGNGGSNAVDYKATDFAMIAASAGMVAERISDLNGLDRAMKTYATIKSPVLLDVTIDPTGYSWVMDVVRGGVANVAIGGSRELQ